MFSKRLWISGINALAITVASASVYAENIPIGVAAKKIGSISKNDEIKKAFLNIPYRLFSSDMAKQNSDISDLALKVQSGEAVGKSVLLHLVTCFAPDVRDGKPSVMCDVGNGGFLIISGDIQVRSELLHVERNSDNYVYTVAVPIGMSGDTPILVVK